MQMNDIQYFRAKEFLRIFTMHMMNDASGASESSAIAALEDLEAVSDRKAKKGLQMAISDCLEMSSDIPMDTLEALDLLLRESGAATLSELRRIHSKKYQRILLRGSIKNEVDYYLVKGVLVDGGNQYLTPEEASQLSSLLTDFEDRFLCATLRSSRIRKPR